MQAEDCGKLPGRRTAEGGCPTRFSHLFAELLIEETRARLLAWKWTTIVPAEDSVAAAGDRLVCGAADGFGEQPAQSGQHSPKASKASKDEQHRVGTSEQGFIRLIVVENHDDRLQFGRAGAVAHEDRIREPALQSGKAEN